MIDLTKINNLTYTGHLIKAVTNMTKAYAQMNNQVYYFIAKTKLMQTV